MAGLFSYGVTTIKVGEIANDGGFGTSLAALGKTLEGSCKIQMDDPSTQEFRSEESDIAELSINTQGNFNVEFSIMNPDADAMVAVFGGTATGSPKTYTPPTQFAIQEKSLELVPRDGMTFKAARVKLVAKINWEASKKNLLLVDIKGTILTPTKTNEPAYSFVE
jgi:hypothetical protein